MSLFIGNLPRDADEKDLHDLFDKIGSCTFRFKGNYAFVDYKDEKDADQAIKELNDSDFGGSRISVQFSKKSEKYDASKDRRPDRGGDRGGDRGFNRDSRGPPRRDGDSGGPKVCYNCQKPGHFARECRERRRSRSRSNDRRGGRGGSRGGFRGGRDFGGRGGRDFDRDRRPRYSRSRSGSNHRRDDRKRSNSGDRK